MNVKDRCSEGRSKERKRGKGKDIEESKDRSTLYV
jgi:hypothetical protein